MKVLPRIFKYNTMHLDDPDPKMSPEEVKEFYSNIYPELTQAEIEGPIMGDNDYRFVWWLFRGCQYHRALTTPVISEPADTLNWLITLPGRSRRGQRRCRHGH